MANLLHTPYAELARGLLQQLSEADLMAVAKAATAGRIQPIDQAEACNAVLLSCPDVAKLLSHRKLTSRVLLLYLFSRNVTLNGHASRVQLVLTVTKHWDQEVKRIQAQKIKQEKACETVIVEVDSDSIKQESAGLRQCKDEPSPQEDYALFEDDFQDVPSLYTSISKEVHKSNYSATQIVNSELTGASNPAFGHYRLNGEHCLGSSPMRTAINSSSVNTTVNTNAPTDTRRGSNDASCEGTSDTSIRVMSDEFSHDFGEWFYAMLNRLQPECANQPGDSLRPEILCSNCRVEMYLVEGDRREECKAESNIECENIMRQLLKKLKLLFMPNLENGLQTQRTSHGMVQVFCCGTLHNSADAFLGIFEQEFGLVLSPLDRTWKISYTKINLKKLDHIYKPSLPPSEAFAIEF